MRVFRAGNWVCRLSTSAAVLVTVPLLGVVATTVPAHAAQVKKTTNGGSACTTDLVKSGSSKASLSVSGSTYVDIPSNGSEARINSSSARIENNSCTSGNGVATSTLKITMRIEVTTLEADSCSIGFPSGVSCTASGKTVTLKQSKTCSDASACRKSWANEWFINPKSSAGAITRVLAKVEYSGKQSGKDSVTGSTKAVTWAPGT